MPILCDLLMGMLHELDQSVAGDSDAPTDTDALDVAVLYQLIRWVSADAEYRGHFFHSQEKWKGRKSCSIHNK